MINLEQHSVISADGTTIAVDVAGHGRPLVIVHGSISTGADWVQVAERLADEFTVHIVNRRGRGPSGDADLYAFEREVEDVAAVMAAVGPDAVLFGHSFGGAVALSYAVNASPVALALYEPALRQDDLIGGDAIPVVESALAAGDPDLALELGMRHFTGESAEGVQWAKSSPAWAPMVSLVGTWPREVRALDVLDVSAERFAGVTSPTLLLRGTESPEWLRETTARLTRILPVSTLVELDGQAHVAMATAPELLADELRIFIRETSAELK